RRAAASFPESSRRAAHALDPFCHGKRGETGMIRYFGKAIALTAALLGVAVATPTAQAGMIPTNVSVTSDGDNFRWTYAVVVTTDVKVNPRGSVTIYDFAGLVQGSIQAPDGWNVTTS